MKRAGKQIKAPAAPATAAAATSSNFAGNLTHDVVTSQDAQAIFGHAYSLRACISPLFEILPSLTTTFPSSYIHQHHKLIPREKFKDNEKHKEIFYLDSV